MDKIFEFIVGEENHAKISTIGRTTSTLYDCYIHAFKAVVSIVNSSQAYEKNTSAPSIPYIYQSQDNSQSLYNYANNLIMFSAPRGGGKTSAMLTFGKALSSKNYTDSGKEKDTDERKRLEDATKTLKDTVFTVLPPIDPTSIDDNHDIISIILARMLNFASTKWDQLAQSNQPNRIDDYIQDKNKLLDQITKCYQGVSSLRQPPKSEDDWNLENLSRLGDSASLKDNLKLAVSAFLTLTQKRASKADFLVIQIDDVDMNFKNVFLMLEYLHNYLLIPQVIILLAADLNFCNKIIYRKFYDDMYSNAMRRDVHCEVADMTDQYLLKLFPPLRRIYLPNTYDLLQVTNDALQIRYLSYVGDTPVNLLQFSADKNEKTCLEQTLLNFIYVKTGLLFIKHKEYHYILPKTQRGIAQLLSVLNQMNSISHLADIFGATVDAEGRIVIPKKENSSTTPAAPATSDPPDPPKEKYFFYNNNPDDKNPSYRVELLAWERNLTRFKGYFMHVWVPENLSEKDEAFLKRVDIDDLSRKSQHVCAHFEQMNKPKSKAAAKEIDRATGTAGSEGRCDEYASQSSTSSAQFSSPDDSVPAEDTGHPTQTDDKLTTYVDMLSQLKENDKDASKRKLTFAIHTYYSIQSMLIVLQQLAVYYEEAEGSGGKKGSERVANFKKLEELYGSQLIPYPSVCKNGIKLTITPKSGAQIDLNLRWGTHESAKGWEDNTNLPKDVPIMMSLLTNNRKPGPAPYQLDFFAPLLNCLYMEKCSDVILDFQNKVGLEGYIDRKDFQRMQDTSLMIVLNWDLQHTLTDALNSQSLDLTAQDRSRFTNPMLYEYVMKHLTNTIFEKLNDCFKLDKAFYPLALVRWLLPLLLATGDSSGHQKVIGYIFSEFSSLDEERRLSRLTLCTNIQKFIKSLSDKLSANGTPDKETTIMDEYLRLTSENFSQHGTVADDDEEWASVMNQWLSLNPLMEKWIASAKNKKVEPDDAIEAETALKKKADELKKVISLYSKAHTKKA